MKFSKIMFVLLHVASACPLFSMRLLGVARSLNRALVLRAHVIGRRVPLGALRSVRLVGSLTSGGQSFSVEQAIELIQQVEDRIGNCEKDISRAHGLSSNERIALDAALQIDACTLQKAYTVLLEYEDDGKSRAATRLCWDRLDSRLHNNREMLKEILQKKSVPESN